MSKLPTFSHDRFSANADAPSFAPAAASNLSQSQIERIISTKHTAVAVHRTAFASFMKRMGRMPATGRKVRRVNRFMG